MHIHRLKYITRELNNAGRPRTDNLAVSEVRAGTLRRNLAVVHHLLRPCRAGE